MQGPTIAATRAGRAAGIALIISLAAGCGPGDAPEGWGLSDEHGDILIASTASGGGTLAVDYDFTQEVALGAPQCIGGYDAVCSGGILLYSSEAPGFGPLEEDEPAAALFALVEGIEILLELTGHSPEASYFLDGIALNDVGDSVVLGESLEGLHLHGEFRLVLPSGTEPAGDYFLRFKLRSDGEFYADSEDFVIMLHAGDEHEHE